MRQCAKRVLTVIVIGVVWLCGTLPVTAMYEDTFDYAEYPVPEVLEAVQWFPCREGFENDDLWEVQCSHDGESTSAQRFSETAEDTGNTNYLDTVRNADGSLTITRNGADGETNYAPYVRTVQYDNMPRLNITQASTLHLDFEATVGWKISLNFGDDRTIDLTKNIARACGVIHEGENGVAGQYRTALNIPDLLREIAQQNDASSEAASALLAMDNIPVPHMTIVCVGDVGSSITMRKWLISSPEDTEGENCWFASSGLITGIYFSQQCLPRSLQTTTAHESTTASATPSETTVSSTTTTNVTPTATAFPTMSIAVTGAAILLVIVLAYVARRNA